MHMRVLILLLFALFAGAACGLLDGASEPYPIATQPSTPEADGGLSALVRGRIEVDLDRGCVWLAAEGRRYPVVWPSGASAERSPFVVTFADGSTAREGDVVSGGGGYISAQTLPELAACSETGEVAVYNQHETVTVNQQ